MRKEIKSSFFKSIALLASGSLIAQLITIISAPFLTRLFTTNQIGIYTYILSLVSIFAPIMNGRYDMSIVTEEKEEFIYPLMKLSIIISTFGSFIITTGYILYFLFFNNENYNYSYTFVLVFILLISHGIINVLTAYNNREREYKIITSVHIIRAVCQNFGAILLGFFKLGLLGLLLPYTVGQLLGINKQTKKIRNSFSKFKNINKTEMIEVLKYHSKQPLYSAPALFANSFSYSSVMFFIEGLFGMNVVGLYSISFRILGLPLSIISSNVSKVFFEEASRESNMTGQFYQSFKKTTLFLCVLAIPMILVMYFIVPQVIGIVFGNDWIESGAYIKILSFMFGIRFVVSSLSTGLIVAKKQNYELILQVSFIASSILCYVISKIFMLSVYDFLKLINFTFSVSFLIYFIMIFKFSIRGDIVKCQQ